MTDENDFQVQIGQSCSTAYVSVTHIPTGKKRAADCFESESVQAARDRLIIELRQELAAGNE